MRRATILKIAGAALGLLLVLGLAAPYLAADQYGKRLQNSIERALGRRVELSDVHFSLLFTGPRFYVGRVTIHEDPTIGIEPMVYVQDPGTMEVAPSLWNLLRGRFVIASISLDGASINLTKTGAAGDPGRWNFASFVDRSVMSAVPAIHVRNSRINFKFADTKSVFYLTDTDLDISPPRGVPSKPGGWSIYCFAKPARTDRPAFGLGSFTLKGRWYVAPERVDLDLIVDRTGLGELTALVNGQAAGVHGSLSSRLHLAGPIGGIGIQGRLNIEDVHRWDLMPAQGQGWTLNIGGRLDLVNQQIEVQSNSPGNSPLPVSLRFRAADYLTQPRWAVALNWNRFPVEPLMELARHMGAQFPPKLKLAGTMDGAIGYSGEGSFQGQLAFHDAALTIPDSPAVRFEQAYVVFDHGHVRLTPAVVHTAEQDEARIEADYEEAAKTLDLVISTDSMKVASLRAQVALAAVPWLEQMLSGEWKGDLRYHREASTAGWTGRLEISDAQLRVPGLADPLHLDTARAQIDHARIVLSGLEAQAGKVAFTGEYRYEPGTTRPHRVKLHADELDAADLEAELMPTLRRSSGLIARALGRTSLPDWLEQLAVDGTLEIDDFALAGTHFENVRARLLWDMARLDIEGLQAKLDRAAITGRLAIDLRGARPAYKLTGKMKGCVWQSGKVDVEGTLETSGTGAQLLANLNSEGNFTGSAWDFGPLALFRSASGNFSLAWAQQAPRWRFTGLNLRTEDETYTGRGATQDDGHLVILLSNGNREMRLSGSLAKPKLDESVPR